MVKADEIRAAWRRVDLKQAKEEGRKIGWTQGITYCMQIALTFFNQPAIAEEVLRATGLDPIEVKKYCGQLPRIKNAGLALPRWEQ